MIWFVCLHQSCRSLKHKLCWKKSPNDPVCLSSHLETFHFNEVKGLEHEMEFVKYILKEARVSKRPVTCLLTVNKVYFFDWYLASNFKSMQQIILVYKKLSSHGRVT